MQQACRSRQQRRGCMHKDDTELAQVACQASKQSLRCPAAAGLDLSVQHQVRSLTCSALCSCLRAFNSRIARLCVRVHAKQAFEQGSTPRAICALPHLLAQARPHSGRGILCYLPPYKCVTLSAKELAQLSR